MIVMKALLFAFVLFPHIAAAEPVVLSCGGNWRYLEKSFEIFLSSPTEDHAGLVKASIALLPKSTESGGECYNSATASRGSAHDSVRAIFDSHNGEMRALAVSGNAPALRVCLYLKPLADPHQANLLTYHLAAAVESHPDVFLDALFRQGVSPLLCGAYAGAKEPDQSSNECSTPPVTDATIQARKRALKVAKSADKRYRKACVRAMP